ncbi:MAG: protein kinase [Polyangiaceae bacterium]|nr:protein kinase [Polyangiaceae bacterium]
MRQAVMLCGGLGTRMHHVSGPLPKVMLEVRGVAFLHRLIARIAAASFDEIVLCVGVGAEHVRRAVADRPPPVPVRFSEDGERLLGTAGALRQALDLLAPEFLVTYGDSYLTFDYAAPLQALEGAADADACLAVYQNKDQLEPSNVAVRDGRVVRYDKRRTLEEPRLDHIDYGAMALRRHVVEALPPGVPYGLDVVQAELARGGRLLAHPTPERFYEIGSPVGLADLERFLDSSPQPLPARPREGADPLSTLPSSGSPEPTDPRAAELSDRLRSYEIWGCIGRGGMSRVWLARHELLAVPVIVKTVESEFENDAKGEARVLSEAKLMARIPSPRVVRALDAGLHEHRPYLVEEYVDGVDLAELDRRRRGALGVGLPLWFVCDVMQSACEALHSAHQTGVVHRDVKPSNLFGSPQTGIRLGDFGIAAVATASAEHEICGTVRFMAPEQIQGAEPSASFDIWGAAATAFDLRYGYPPFASLPALLDPRLSPSFPPPPTPAEAYFQHVLAGMMRKSPDARTHNILEPLRHFALLSQMLRVATRHGSIIALDRTTFRVHDCVVRFRAGDLAKWKADAIVSSANDLLGMRSGVADALRRAGGDVIEEEALSCGRQPLGSCVATTAGALEARHVLHAVSAWKEASCVGRATQRALLLADELGHRSLAFAALGTGAARISMEASASAMMTALRQHLELGATRIKEVDVLVWDARALELFREVGEDALHGNLELGWHDIGLPADQVEVRPESATWIDAGRGSGPRTPKRP